MSKWQPIETAPKDGTRILAFLGEETCVVVGWDDVWATGEPAWNDTEYTYEPTHWMPLPAPPQDEAACEGGGQ